MRRWRWLAPAALMAWAAATNAVAARIILLDDDDAQEQPSQPKPPPALPPSAIPPEVAPQSDSAPARVEPPDNRPGPVTQQQPEALGQSPRGLAGRVLRAKVGESRAEKYVEQLKAMAAPALEGGRGAPNADVWFDRTLPRTGNDDGLRPAGSKFFSSYKAATVVDTRAVLATYKGIPGGGVVLEGAGRGLEPAEEIGYDRKYHALVFDASSVYFIKIPRRNAALLCRAIAEADEVGVSLGRVQVVYGAVPATSDLAFDLKLADKFLGDIVFGNSNWSQGYRYARGYRRKDPEEAEFSLAVMFRFGDFAFETANREVVLASGGLSVTLIPLSEQAAPDGNTLPDDEKINSNSVPAAFEANARHIAENAPYYQRERIINRAFLYGEFASMLRELKRQGVDLSELAQVLEGSGSL